MTSIKGRRKKAFLKIRRLVSQKEEEDCIPDELDLSHRKREENSVFFMDDSISKLTLKTEEEASDEDETERTLESTLAEVGYDESVAAPYAAKHEHSDLMKTETRDEILDVTDSNTDKNDVGESDEKRVQFSLVEVRKYSICLGDNPGANRGVPISISWEVFESKVLGVDEFEMRSRKASKSSLRIDPLDRVIMLKRAGYSGREIKEGTAAIDNVRNRRQETRNSLRLYPLHEAVERIKRGLLNATLYRNRKRKEKTFLDCYKRNASKN